MQEQDRWNSIEKDKDEKLKSQKKKKKLPIRGKQADFQKLLSQFVV